MRRVGKEHKHTHSQGTAAKSEMPTFESQPPAAKSVLGLLEPLTVFVQYHSKFMDVHTVKEVRRGEPVSRCGGGA